MPICSVCGHHSSRKRRNIIQKVLFYAVFRCGDCGRRDHVWRRSLFVIFRRFVECPQCGTRDLSKLARRDWVDKMSRNPLRRLLGLVGFPLYHCTYCRLQFRDWRKLASR